MNLRERLNETRCKTQNKMAIIENILSVWRVIFHNGK